MADVSDQNPRNASHATTVVDGNLLVTKSLARLGVTHMFGVVGIPVTAVATHAVHNEQAAGYAAPAYGYLTGKPGVFLTASGPGWGYSLAGLSSGMVNTWPVVMISGSCKQSDAGRGDFQELDQIAAVKPFLKFSVKAKHVRGVHKRRVQRVRLCHRQLAQLHSSSSHIVFQCMITALIAPIQMKYQSTELTPFDTHPVNMFVFLAAVCSFGLAVSIEARFKNQFIKGVIISSSVLASLSLAAIFLPHPLGRICLGLWVVCPIALARHFIKHIYHCLKHDIKEKSLLACDEFKRFWGYLIRKNQHLPQ